MSDKPLSESFPAKCPLAHELECPLRHAYHPHTVVDSAWTETPLGNLEATPFTCI